MGWLNNLLGNGGVVEGIKEGIDKSILTDEERLDYHKQMLKAYEPFKLIQRALAIAVTSLFSFVMVLEVILIVVSYWMPEIAHIPVMINELESVSTIGYSFLAIMSLYFSGGVIDSIKGRK